MPRSFDTGKGSNAQARGLDKTNAKRVAGAGGAINPKQYNGVRPTLLRPRSVNSSFESTGPNRASPANSSLDHSGYLSDRTDHRKQIVGTNACISGERGERIYNYAINGGNTQVAKGYAAGMGR